MPNPKIIIVSAPSRPRTQAPIGSVTWHYANYPRRSVPVGNAINARQPAEVNARPPIEMPGAHAAAGDMLITTTGD